MRSVLLGNWATVTLGDLRRNESTRVVPADSPDETFELWSVPSFEHDRPDVVSGSAIGSDKQSVSPGTVLVCKINPRINRVWVVRPSVGHRQIASTEWIPFAPLEELDPRYLCYCLRQSHFRDFLATNVSGVGGSLMRVRPAVLDKFTIPLPPLAEQQRIVAAIEEHLSRLDAAVVGLERVRAQLPRYRAAVLASVVEAAAAGTNARMSTLGTELRESLRNGNSSKESRNGKGVRTLTLTAVTKGDFSERNTKLTVADPAKVADLWLEDDDLLIERSNTPELVGTARLYRGPREFAIFPDLLIRARVHECLLPRYVEAVLMAPATRRYFRDAAQGIAGTMPKISQRTVEAMPIPVPPIEEQRRLLEDADQRLSVCQAMESTVMAALKHSLITRQSILRRAFSGQLVSQDPNDEPASALLERIRAERAAAPVRKVTRSRRKAARGRAPASGELGD